ncbi:MAG: glycosyltransferase family 4 protein [bacterium]
MKICFITNRLDIICGGRQKGGDKYGWGRYSWEIVKRIAAQPDFEVEVLIEEPSGYKKERCILKKCFSLRELPILFLNALKARKYIKNCDIIHALDAYPYGVIAALANLGLNKKLIINGVGTFSVAPLESPLKSNLLRWAYRKASVVLCISNYTCQEIKKRISSLNNMKVIFLGIDVNYFKRNPYPKIQVPKKFILSVGVLKKRKGQHITIPAFAKVVKKYSELKYIIIGDQSNKSYFALLKELVKENNLEDKVIFLANVSDKDLIDYYSTCTFSIIASQNDGLNFEGFGLIHLEASACGKPVIGTYDNGCEDAIVDGVTGFLVPQNDIEATAQAMLKILDNPGLDRKMGREGRKWAEKLNWDNIIKKYIAVYQ